MPMHRTRHQLVYMKNIDKHHKNKQNFSYLHTNSQTQSPNTPKSFYDVCPMIFYFKENEFFHINFVFLCVIDILLRCDFGDYNF